MTTPLRAPSALATILACVFAGALAHTAPAQSLHTRQRLGLSTNRAEVERLEQDSEARNRGRDTFGVALADAELALLERRADVQASMADVRRHVTTLAPNTFAGLYADNDGRINVLFTENVEQRVEQLRQDAAYPDQIRGQRVERSLEDLERLHRRVRLATAELAQSGVDVAVSHVLERGNVVRVGVRNATPDDLAAVRRRFGDGVRVQSAVVEKTVCRDRTFCRPPLLAGLLIYDGQYACTSGFIAQRGPSTFRLFYIDATFYLMTAGHCFVDRRTWYHQAPIGDIAGNAYNATTPADAGIINIDDGRLDSSNGVYITSNSYRPVTRMQSASDDAVGQYVCFSGARSNATLCGNVATRGDVVQYGDGVTLTDQRTADMCNREGDSGSPVFFSQTAVGLVSGYVLYLDAQGRPEDCDTIYSHIDHATDELDVDVSTSDPRNIDG